MALTGLGARLADNLTAEEVPVAGPTGPPAADQHAAGSPPAWPAEARPAATLLAQVSEPVVTPSPPRPEAGRSGAVIAPPPPKPVPAAAERRDRTRDMERLIAEMQRELEKRDTIIFNLLERVEDLERQVALEPGVEAPEGEAPAAPQPPEEDVAPPVEAQPAAPGQFEVDEELVDRALERALVEAGALLLRPGQVEVEPSISYTRREDEVPTIVLQDGVPVEFTRTIRRNEVTTAMGLRFGLPYDSQLELFFPYGYEEESTVFGASESSDSAWGYGDLRVGIAKTLLREDGWWPDLIGRVRWDSNTGQEKDGILLGSGFHELSGSLTAVTRQDPLAFVGSVGYETTFENDGRDPGDEFSLSLGTVLAVSPETSLRFSIQQTFSDEVVVDGRELTGSDDVDAMLTLGASSVIAPRTLLDVAAGIGVTDGAPDYLIQVSLPIRFSLRGIAFGDAS